MECGLNREFETSTVLSADVTNTNKQRHTNCSNQNQHDNCQRCFPLCKLNMHNQQHHRKQTNLILLQLCSRPVCVRWDFKADDKNADSGWNRHEQTTTILDGVGYVKRTDRCVIKIAKGGTQSVMTFCPSPQLRYSRVVVVKSLKAF